MPKETIPVHILTGFLGSGKTTLLNRALASGLGSETAVIVNEFGEVALDQLFIEARSEEMLVLKSGCICCTIRADLVTTLMKLAAMADAGQASFRRIVIETSGISDAEPILTTLRSDFNLLTRFHIGTAVCAVDATLPEEMRTRPECMRQIASADVCVITKDDLAGDLETTQARDWILRLNPLAAVVSSTQIDFASWLDLEPADPGARADRLENMAAADDRHGVRTLVLRSDTSPSWPRLAVWLSALIHLHGDRILRLKGVLWDDERETWIAVHGVRRFLHPPEHLSGAPDRRVDRACLVFITQSLDPVLIERSYRRWVLAQPHDRVSNDAPYRHGAMNLPARASNPGVISCQ